MYPWFLCLFVYLHMKLKIKLKANIKDTNCSFLGSLILICLVFFWLIEVSMTIKCHNYTLQTNPQHHEE